MFLLSNINKMLIVVCLLLNIFSLWSMCMLHFHAQQFTVDKHHVTCVYSSNVLVIQVYVGDCDVSQFVYPTYPMEYKRLSFYEPLHASSLAFKMSKKEGESQSFLLISCESSNGHSEWNFKNSTRKTGPTKWKTVDSNYSNDDMWWTNTHSPSNQQFISFTPKGNNSSDVNMDKIDVSNTMDNEWVLLRRVPKNSQDLFAII